MIKYLIEDLKEQHGKWLCFGEMFDSSKPMESERSKWTNDPNKALQFDSREEAEEYNQKYWRMEGIEVTEHIFVTKREEEIGQLTLEAYPIRMSYGGGQPSFDSNAELRTAFMKGFSFRQWLIDASMTHPNIPLHIKFRMYKNQKEAE